ncbi:putative stress-induced protein [Legionella beliardensis]|uniref:Putative stress-induced protein n=1 Tax=Legionella beliardensis TaxID=91822 RepID=A0A378I479_9GAMM|nr:YicC/YloC family endoribonuclease [Legionella beliardensis]STX29652.1 putative stress-induced protein [Legionella beliardensis]
MTHSMTAFARAQTQCNELGFCWEIKSVNHRYLDVSFRLPETWRFLETELRAIIRDYVARGKLECQLKMTDQGSTEPSLLVNEKLVDSLLAITQQLSTAKQLPNDLTLSTLLAWPGVIHTSELNIEQFTKSVTQLFRDGLAQLQRLRRQEGEALKLHVQHRLQRLQEEINKARAFVQINTQQARDKFLTKLQLLELDVDNSRIEQELAIILTKMDVSEELDRLTVHCQEVGNILNSKEASGRRLDFLMQELNREANTLSAKSDTVALTQSAVEMKVLIEQMREQIQNIE